MSSTKDLKEKAIALRKEGKTYSEILLQIPVAKSTLSLWLRKVGLSRAQKQVITQKRRDAQMRGGAMRRRIRIEQTADIFKEAINEVGTLSVRERLFIGTALYWAEGSKEKADRPGQGIDFGNTDPAMMSFMLKWLYESFDVAIDQVAFSLYIHENHRHRIGEVLEFWREALSIPDLSLSYIYFKKHNPKTKRSNTRDSYHGTLRIRVRQSSRMQRRILGLVYGITGEPCRVV